MTRKFKIISSTGEESSNFQAFRPETKLRHFRNVNASVLQNALDTWGDVWNEFEGTVTHGCLVTPEAAKGFKPKCGWPEFLEKMWLLKHYLDYAKSFCEGK
ncbi:MAG: hypothetical protein A2V67_18065 [Deltaproteobacteria bacterium RBG_13_61_14]|nr:MAG: hypothetical protein A2V67_18065 [Deltaproteobacteria bacterium RBG_13_61_14]